MPYYRVEHQYTGEVFRTESTSKNQLKKELTRFDGTGYSSFWTINEVDVTEWNNLKRKGIEPVPVKYWS